MKTLRRIILLVLPLLCASELEASAKDKFTFGGYVKLDAMSSIFHDGSVSTTSALRDFHFPGAIPVGGTNDTFTTNDYHAKESRFHLGTESRIGGRLLRSFFELDFLLAGQGDERVSNSFNPRLRHAYFSYGDWTLGQTWTTFQILDLPDDLDFAGAADGIIFNRQPQVRFRTGDFQFAIENSESTLTPYLQDSRITSGSSFSPDLVARYNLDGYWGNLALAGLFRLLNHEYDEAGATKSSSAPAFGFSCGGKIKVGQDDDLRFQISVGLGLGRYAALNFANGGVIKADNDVKAIPSLLGFVGYRHLWKKTLRSNLNISGIGVDNDTDFIAASSNRFAWSVSGNLLYSPIPEVTFGMELMRGYRELEDGTQGKFDRLQVSGIYHFSYSARGK